MKSKRLSKTITSAVVCTVLSVVTSTVILNKDVQAASLERIGEDNRYLTASKLAKEVFKSSDAVVLVSGKGYADAVAASPFAKKLNAPILLTSGTKLESEVLKAMKNLGARTIYIIGGTGNISSEVENELIHSGFYIKRIAGKDKFDTNIKIAEEVIRRSGKRTVIMANGEVGYPDAISAASIAANMGYPLLITSTKTVPNNVKKFIKDKKLEVLVVGGTGVISDKALKSVNGKRIAAGKDRFDTNLKLLSFFKKNLNFGEIYVSCGGNDRKNMFADSLIASAAAAKTNSPVILSGLGAGNAQIQNANKFIKSNLKKDVKLRIVGGKSVVSSVVENDIKKIISNDGKMGIGSQLPYEKKFVLIGNKAYSMNYYMTHMDKIDSDIEKGTGLLFYGYKEGSNNRILNPNSKGFLTEEDLMDECGKTIKFYDSYIEKTYVYNGNVYKEEQVSAQRYNSTIKSTEMGDKRIIGVTLNSLIKEDIAGAKYFQIKGSPYIKSIDGSEEIQCMFSRDGDNKFTAEVWILNYDKKVIAKGKVDITALTNSFGVSYKIDFQLMNDEANNASGNIINGGMALQYGDNIYYNNTGDANKLYKSSLDGSYNRAISFDDARYINAFENIIIYSNYKDNFAIYKVNDDGSKPEKICNHRATYVNVVGEYIYYSNHSDGGRIYKIKINKNENGLSFGSPQIVCSDDAEYLNVVGNTIYYSNYSDGNKLYAININGTGRVKLTNESSNFVNVNGSYIYYITNAGALKRVGTDGNVPRENVLASKVTSVNAMGDYIYYTNASDGDKIYRINKKDLKNEKVCDAQADFINITGNFIDVNKHSISLGAENIFYNKNNKMFNYDMKNVISSGSKSGQAIAKPNYTLKISKVYDIEKGIETYDLNRSQKYIDEKYLPDKVSVLMNDDTVRELIVVWDKEKASESSGVRSYTGELIGYDAKAKLKLSRVSKGLRAEQINILNSSDGSDTLVATGLNNGDVIKVYKNADKTGYMGSSTAYSAGNVTMSLGSSNLDSAGGVLWVTITSSNPGSIGGNTSNAESAPIAVNYDAEGPKMPSSLNCYDRDDSNFGVDGRDFMVNWSTPTRDVVKQYIYILRDSSQNSVIDYSKHKPMATIYDNKTTTWTGNYDLKQDSNGYDLAAGDYKIFVVFENASGKKSSPKYSTLRVKSEGTSDVRASSVSFKDSSITMALGDTKMPEIVINPSNATNKEFVLESYNNNIVCVEGKTIRALATGTTTIKVTSIDGNYTNTCTVTVGINSITSVTKVHLNLNSLNLRAGDKTQLTAWVEPENVPNPNIIWTSSNNSIAKVDSTGRVVAVGSGQVRITALSQGTNIYDECTVNVTGGNNSVSGITLPSNMALTIGTTQQINASFTPSSASYRDVIWTSSSPYVVSIDSDGKITGMNQGTTSITGKIPNTNIQSTCNITVNKVSTSNLKSITGCGGAVNSTVTISNNVANSNVDWSKVYVKYSSSQITESQAKLMIENLNGSDIINAQDKQYGAQTIINNAGSFSSTTNNILVVFINSRNEVVAYSII